MEHRNDVEELKREVGRRLVELRGETSQRDYAERLGIATNTLGRYERGERLPDGDLLLAFMEQGFSVEWLMSGRGAKQSRGSDKARSDGHPFVTTLGVGQAASEFVLVPRYNVVAEGGEGLEVFEEEVVSHIAFRRDWLEKEGLLGDPLSIIGSSGDSMWPTIPHGWTVLVNNRFTSYVSPGIYVLSRHGRSMIKRLDMDPVSGDLSIISDNHEKYAARVVTPDLQSDLKISGRAVWWAPGKADM